MIAHDYAPTDAGEYVTGVPRAPLTADWLAAEAARQGVSARALSAMLAGYRRVDGQPLYPVHVAPGELALQLGRDTVFSANEVVSVLEAAAPSKRHETQDSARQ